MCGKNCRAGFSSVCFVVSVKTSMKDTFPVAVLCWPVTSHRGSVAGPASSVPGPSSTVGDASVPEPPQSAVAPLPEAGPRTGPATQRSEPRPQEGARSVRSVGPARPALLPVVRRSADVVGHHVVKAWRRGAHVGRPWTPRRHRGAGRPAAVPLPQPGGGGALLTVVVADFPVFQLNVERRKLTRRFQIHVDSRGNFAIVDFISTRPSCHFLSRPSTRRVPLA